MALDGLMLRMIKQELEDVLLNARVEKIYQPSREELVLTFRGNHKLLLCSKSATARVHLTQVAVENPQQPPMLCMLMRKLIGSARLSAIRQEGFERALYFDFDTTNELGDPVTLTLAAELMGRHSNLILIGQNGCIIDSVRRVGLDKSSVRQILPGLLYQVPPPLVRTPITKGAAAVCEALVQANRDVELPRLLGETLEGASPLVCRELSHRALHGCEAIFSMLTPDDHQELNQVLNQLHKVISNRTTQPTLLLDSEGVPKDFCFISVEQYGEVLEQRTYASLSSLLDAFYGQRDLADRMKQKMSDFSRLITSRIERIERKLDAQRQELEACRNREVLRIKGDLLSSSLHLLEKGLGMVRLQNYYHPDAEDLEILLDPRLTPVQNAQKYYKDYRRADTAEKMLQNLLLEGENELTYLDSVYDLMLRAKSEGELAAIRGELAQEGYLRSTGQKGRKPQALPPLKYLSSDGFVILSGRNNLQNDKLTLKDSHKDDIWFHTQNSPGSHTLILTEGKTVPDSTLTQAAIIAATNSRAGQSRKVAVNYTEIRNVKKPPAARPGMVTYKLFQTAIVNPSPELLAELSVK